MNSIKKVTIAKNVGCLEKKLSMFLIIFYAKEIILCYFLTVHLKLITHVLQTYYYTKIVTDTVVHPTFTFRVSFVFTP